MFKVLFSFITASLLIFAFYLSFPPNNPSGYMQSVCVLVEDMDGSGSGLVVLHKGETYIITCAHVLSTFFGIYMPVTIVHDTYKRHKLISHRTYIAKAFKVDKDNDVAILKINQKTHFRNTVQLDKTSYLGVGESIWMIGSPYGNKCYNTVSKGIISRYDYTNMFRYQIDCSTYMGVSGGGVFDDSGNFYGISCSMRNVNIGYVIPIQTIRSFIKKSCPELLEK